MTLLHPSRDRAEEAMGRAFDEIERLTKLMNRFDEATAIAQLNKDGYLEDLPSEILHVLGNALRYHSLSQGAFDITVKPVVDLFKEKLGGKEGAIPDKKEMDGVLNLVGSGMIRLEGREVRFEKPGMGITLDGIAKGYIVDKASELLGRYGIENHLINAGGDIRTRGVKGEGKPWTVAIQDPFKTRNYPDLIHMRDGAVATSGNYEIYFDREKMFHHIVDPGTGLSPQLSASVSVLAPEALEADALSTTVFVMEPVQGRTFINALPNRECLIVTKDGSLEQSVGWRSAAI
jgi:thiamine biosynthesis lipoprotein